MPPRAQPGYAMAWYAMVLTFVFLPLMALAVEVPRLLWVQSHLQTAADAAAEAGADLGLDVDYFRATGDVQFTNAGEHASAVFAQTVNDAGLVRYAPELTSVSVDEANNTVQVTAASTVQVLLPALIPSVVIRVQATAQSRVATLP